MTEQHASPKLVLIGGGGHAKVIIEAVRAAGLFEIAGLVDPAQAGQLVLGVPVVTGGDEVLPGLRASGIGSAVIALGSNSARHRLGEIVRALGFQLPAIVHPTALIAPSAVLGDGVVVMARAVVGTQTKVADLAIVNTAAIIDHDNVIGAGAHVAPGCALAGNVHVGARALVGIGSAVRPGITIGDDAVIGAGSAVVSNIAAGSIVGGAPARLLPKRGST